MIKERYCSYELSQLLREKGFDEPCKSVYEDCGDYIDFYYTIEEQTDLHLSVDEILRPTHQTACDWLRDKGYHVEIYASASGYKFIISKTPYDGTDIYESGHDGPNDGGAWDDYGECIDYAIKYCLTELV